MLSEVGALCALYDCRAFSIGQSSRWQSFAVPIRNLGKDFGAQRVPLTWLGYGRLTVQVRHDAIARDDL